MPPDLGKLIAVDLRSVWPTEAQHFTPWLADNIDQLAAALGLDLEVIAREHPVGDFSVDVLAKDLGTDREVIIENQLEPTDHNHLGQLITYAAGRNAGVVVWICREFREEHRQALDWLNRSGSAEYFGVVIELLRVDDSRPAANFKVVSWPNSWSRETAGGAARGEISGKRAAYQQFFQELIDELRDKHHFTNAKVGQPQNWYTFTSGTRGFTYSVSFANTGRVRTELYIDLYDQSKNKATFDSLLAEKGAFEAAFGAALEWERLDERRACRIASYWPGGIEDPEETLQEHRKTAIDRLLRLKRTFGPHLPALGEQ